MAPLPDQPVFFYDLASPACYLVAERVSTTLQVVPEWEPVLGPQIGYAHREPDRELIEQLARRHELQPLRWPQPWPPESEQAMLAATYAKQIGRVVAFSLACFRQAFAGGRDLGDTDTVLIAAAACEMHPAAVLKGIGLASVAGALNGAAARARDAGVRSLPAIVLDGRVFEGEQAPERASATIGASR